MANDLFLNLLHLFEERIAHFLSHFFTTASTILCLSIRNHLKDMNDILFNFALTYDDFDVKKKVGIFRKKSADI